MSTHHPSKAQRPMSLGAISLLFLLPALLFYAVFELWPIVQTIWYSLYDWNGIDESTFVGLGNYKTVFTDPDLYGSILHSFYHLLLHHSDHVRSDHRRARQRHEIQDGTRLRAGLPVPAPCHSGRGRGRGMDLDARR